MLLNELKRAQKPFTTLLYSILTGTLMLAIGIGLIKQWYGTSPWLVTLGEASVITGAIAMFAGGVRAWWLVLRNHRVIR